MKRPPQSSRLRVSRRRILVSAAAAPLAAPAILTARSALAQDKPRELKVRTWGGIWLESLQKAVSEPFSAATGIPVTHLVFEDYLTREKILEALKAGKEPPVNVDWNTTINATMLARAGATVDLSDLAGLDALLPVAHPEGTRGWPLVSIYAYVYVLAYRQAAFQAGPPDSWQAMVDPKFKGRVALFDDGIGIYASAQVAGGGTLAEIPDDMAPCWSFLEKVKQNRPLLGKDPDFTHWLETGQADVCCTVTADARPARQKTGAVSWVVPREGAEYATDAMAVPKGQPENETYWAKRYVERAISRPGQQALSSDLGLPGMLPGLTPPADMQGDPAYPTSEADFKRLLKIPTGVMVDHQDAWYARFHKLMGDG